MPTEQFIRKKAVENLRKEGWITWFGPKIKFKQTDIFGIIDLLALKGRKQKNIQLTTLPNTSTRRKKIISFLKKHKVKLPIEIWAWNQKKKVFRKERINIKKYSGELKKK